MSVKSNDETVIVDFDTLAPDAKKLIQEAIEGRKVAYNVYSNFAVGACLESEDGTLFRGCNVENVSYGLSICAEQTAIVKAVSEGHRKFKSVAVIGDREEGFTTPCGACRQFLAEFNPEMTVYVTQSTLGKVLVSDVKSLLPYMFAKMQFTKNNGIN